MPRPPVILQILPSLGSGGVERGTIDIARAIVDASGKALVASSGGRLVDTLTAQGATHITLPMNSKKPWRIWRNIKAINDIIMHYNVDIVHARSRAPAWSAYYAARNAGVPFVTTFHGTYNLGGPLKRRYNQVMIKGKPVIAVSHFIADHIATEYDADRRNIRVIARGVDMAAFDPENIRHDIMADLMEDWQLDMLDVPILFMPARVTRWKGQHVVLNALATLPHRNFVCVFAGDVSKHPRYTTELYEMAERLQLNNNVRFVPPTSHMPEAYNLCDLVLAPSVRPEAFGRIPVEASAMGKPVIAASHGGARETVLPGETGWLVPPDDAQALSATINEALARTENEKSKLAHVARAHVQQHFSLQTMQDRTLDIYEEVMRGAHRQ